jgi:hypothetical protein
MSATPSPSWWARQSPAATITTIGLTSKVTAVGSHARQDCGDLIIRSSSAPICEGEARIVAGCR